MRRRSFLQTLSSLLFLPHLTVPARPAAQPLLQDLTYTDSDGNTDFSSLKDGNTTSGGVVYGA